MQNEHKIGAIGRPGYGWKVRVVDDERHSVQQGTPGELMVKGPGVMKAYYQQPGITCNVLYNGWLLTGDDSICQNCVPFAQTGCPDFLRKIPSVLTMGSSLNKPEESAI